MGLGKTVQAISLLIYLSHMESKSINALVVVPGSTIGNWKKEFGLWSPHFEVVVYHGNQTEVRAYILY